MNSDMGLIPAAHQLAQASPFIDSGVHLDLLARSSSGVNVIAQPQTTDLDDEVFVMHSESPSTETDANVLTSSSSIDSSGSSTTVVTDQNSQPSTGLARSRRSHFSRKDSTPETTKSAVTDGE